MSDERAEGRAARAIDLVLFVAPFMLAGIVVFTLLWSGPWPYADLARDNGVTAITFVGSDGGALTYDIARATEVHTAWSSYVTGGRDVPPEYPELRVGDDEYRHMADVRRVFDVVKFLVPASIVLIVLRLQRAWTRGAAAMWRLVRDGALAAVAVAVVLALATAVAFDALFMVFHYVLFPQGNFLFDPRTSNIVRLWPEWYFAGMFLRVGLSYLAAAAALAAIAALRLRRAR